MPAQLEAENQRLPPPKVISSKCFIFKECEICPETKYLHTHIYTHYLSLCLNITGSVQLNIKIIFLYSEIIKAYFKN